MTKTNNNLCSNFFSLFSTPKFYCSKIKQETQVVDKPKKNLFLTNKNPGSVQEPFLE